MSRSVLTRRVSRNRHFKKRRRIAFLWALLLAAAISFCGGAIIEMYKIHVTAEVFTESPRQLENPNRGFYRIYAFEIFDEKTDYRALVQDSCREDTGSTLALVEINLRQYRLGSISEAGLRNIERLFAAWAEGKKRLIVRFAYDLEGKNLQYEPQSLQIILEHMEQLSGILKRYEDTIFILQGLFVGNWGEMHSTRYTSAGELRLLAQTLADAAGEKTYLAVRTPAQWRMVTQEGRSACLAARIGLFNDGMMGSESDLGTYDMGVPNARAQELAFQERLCARVPNGGEAVIANTYNDFGNAVRYLETMHITYLNEGYDRAVLDKWAGASVSGGVFAGMDGLSYIERRMGYRLLISGVSAKRGILRQSVTVRADFQNVGFAPLYAPPEAVVTLIDEKGEIRQAHPAAHSLQALTGGRDTGRVEAVCAEISTRGLQAGSYSICLSLTDPGSGQAILLANGQDCGQYGYCLGSIEVRY